MPARTPDEEVRDIRTLLEVAPGGDVVNAVRAAQAEARRAKALVYATRLALEEALRLLKRAAL